MYVPMDMRLLRSPDEGGAAGGGDDGASPGGDGAGNDDGAKGSGGKMVQMSQAAFDRLIDDRIGKTAAKVRDEAARAESQRLKSLGVESWDELGDRLKGGSASGDDRSKEAAKEAFLRAQAEATKVIDPLKKENVALRELAETLGVRNAVKVVAKGLGAFDADEIVDLMKGRFRLDMESKTVEVLTPGGNPAVGPNGPITVEEAVAEFAESKPHLFRTDARAGSGKGPSPAAAKRNHYKRSELMGLDREEKERVAAGLAAGEITIDDRA